MKQIKVEAENNQIVINAKIGIKRIAVTMLSETGFVENIGAFPTLKETISDSWFVLTIKTKMEVQSITLADLNARISMVEDALKLIENLNNMSKEIENLYSRVENYEKDMKHAKEAQKAESSE